MATFNLRRFSKPEMLRRIDREHFIAFPEPHAEQFLFRPRSFEYFRATNGSIPEFEEPSEETIRALEANLDEWFSKKRRGRAI